MFNLVPEAEVPEFRLRVADYVPGFRVREDGSTGPTAMDRVYNSFAPNDFLAPPPIPTPNSDLRVAVDCAKVIADCHDRCIGRFELKPFPGPSGTNQFFMYRRCRRDCVEPSGCSY
jgi:hypothetical protein